MGSHTSMVMRIRVWWFCTYTYWHIHKKDIIEVCIWWYKFGTCTRRKGWLTYNNLIIYISVDILIILNVFFITRHTHFLCGKLFPSIHIYPSRRVETVHILLIIYNNMLLNKYNLFTISILVSLNLICSLNKFCLIFSLERQKPSRPL